MNTSNGSPPHGTPEHPKARRLRFGPYEVNLQERELRRQGTRINIQQKPFQVLEILLESPGQLISRASLARRLWPDLFVNFDHSLNTAVNVLRQVLKDSSRRSQFIETRPGLGYRFIAPVEEVVDPDQTPTAHHPEDDQGYAVRALSTMNFEVYQDYRKGRYFLDKVSEEDSHRAVAYFEAALAQDPHYAPAYSGLADTYCLFALLGCLHPNEAYWRAKDCATRALRLDKELAEAHSSLGRVKMLFEWDLTSAEQEYQRALEINSGYARAYQWRADLLALTGRNEDAAEQIRHALNLDPLSLAIHLEQAWILYIGRRFEESAAQSWKALTLEPRFAAAQHLLGLAYEQLDMREEAITEFRNSEACSPSIRPAILATLGHALARGGQRQEAIEKLRELDELSEQRFVSQYWRAILCAGLGEAKPTIDSLERAFEQRDVWLLWMGREPRFNWLYAERRFRTLAQKIAHGAGQLSDF